jgi:hypothetical protein
MARHLQTVKSDRRPSTRISRTSHPSSIRLLGLVDCIEPEYSKA